MKIIPQAVTTIAAGLALGLALASPLQAQATPTMSSKSGVGTMDRGSKMSAGGMMDTGGMMQMHEKMQADTKAMDDELDGLVVKMNQASRSDKMVAMAAVITKMAQQRQVMDQKMTAMQASMMHGMGGGMKMDPPIKMSPSMMIDPPMSVKPQDK